MDPANAGLIRDWTVAYWDALHPFAEAGAYVNFMMDEGQSTGSAPPTATTTSGWCRSRTRYDPTNLFRVNQNIVPTG